MENWDTLEGIAQRTRRKNMMVSIVLCLEDKDVATYMTADADANVGVGMITMQDSSVPSCLLENAVKSVLKRTRQTALGVWQQTM